jgi:hypothetical protein
VSGKDMRGSTIRHVLQTFFDGSVPAAMAALLDAEEKPPSEQELDAMTALIQQVREQGR